MRAHMCFTLALIAASFPAAMAASYPDWDVQGTYESGTFHLQGNANLTIVCGTWQVATILLGGAVDLRVRISHSDHLVQFQSKSETIRYTCLEPTTWVEGVAPAAPGPGEVVRHGPHLAPTTWQDETYGITGGSYFRATHVPATAADFVATQGTFVPFSGKLTTTARIGGDNDLDVCARTYALGIPLVLPGENAQCPSFYVPHIGFVFYSQAGDQVASEGVGAFGTWQTKLFRT